VWVAALELRGCYNFQTPDRTVRDGAGLTSFMRNEPRCKEGKPAVAEEVVTAVREAADGTASGNAETVPSGTEVPATGGGGWGPDESLPRLRRFSTDGSACLLRRYGIVHLEAPIPAEWPLVIALSAYAVDHVDASLLPALRKPGSAGVRAAQVARRRGAYEVAEATVRRLPRLCPHAEQGYAPVS